MIENLFPSDLLNDVLININEKKDKINWFKMCSDDFNTAGTSAKKLSDYLIGDEWLNFLREMTGIEDLRADKKWVGAGINYEPRGAHLEPHTDFNHSPNGWRRINLLLFLSKNWKEEWGGYGELGHIEDGDFVKDVTYSPDFNKTVLFETSNISYHGFDLVRCPEDEVRIVITCYYYSDSPGPHSKKKTHTSYIGWDKERKQNNEYSNRRGTGWKELE